MDVRLTHKILQQLSKWRVLCTRRGLHLKCSGLGRVLPFCVGRRVVKAEMGFIGQKTKENAEWHREPCSLHVVWRQVRCFLGPT